MLDDPLSLARFFLSESGGERWSVLIVAWLVAVAGWTVSRGAAGSLHRQGADVR